MTVRQLTQELTTEELTGWAAFYELKSDEEEKAMNSAKTGKAVQAMSRR
jgi:hypothetical protein